VLQLAGVRRQAQDGEPDFPRSKAGPPGAGVTPFDYQGARQRQQGGRGGGGHQAFGEGVSAGRGDRGGRGGRGRDGGRGGRAGRDGGRRPAGGFNPYDIPEEHLIKGGKRSGTQVRSGNKSFTFK
jgi:hypothetical protein